MTDSIADIFLRAAAELGDAERRLRKPPRKLFVVEFMHEDRWLPLCGDAYPDSDEAQRVAEEPSSLTKRVVRYVPEEK